MKISNPFKAKTVAQDASLEKLQKTFKNDQKLELKNGVFKAQTSGLLHELKLLLGVKSAVDKEAVIDQRRAAASTAIYEKVGASLANPNLAAPEDGSMSGKQIRQLRTNLLENKPAITFTYQAQSDYLQPQFMKLLESESLPLAAREQLASALTECSIAAAAELTRLAAQNNASSVSLPDALRLTMAAWNASSNTEPSTEAIVKLGLQEQQAADRSPPEVKKARAHLAQMNQNDRQAIVAGLSPETCVAVRMVVDEARDEALKLKMPFSDADRADLYTGRVADLLSEDGVFGNAASDIDANRQALDPAYHSAFSAYVKLVDAVVERGATY